jgi:hypothetical protein
MSQLKKKGKWDSSDEESDAKSTKKTKGNSNGGTQQAATAVAIPEPVPVAPAVAADPVPAAVEPASRYEVVPVTREPAVCPTASSVNDSALEDVCEPHGFTKQPLPPQLPTERKHNPIFDGCRSVDCYQRVNFIDQGTYGMVFKAKCRETGEMFALKQIKFGPEASKVGFPITALREVNILLALQHPNIVSVKEMVVGSSIDKIYMVMEYCENDLKTCMKASKQSFSTAEVSHGALTYPDFVLIPIHRTACVGEAADDPAAQRRGPHAPEVVHTQGPEVLEPAVLE